MVWAKLGGATDFSLADMPEAPAEGLLKASLSMKVKDYAAASNILTSVLATSPGIGQAFMLLDLRAACALHLGKAEAALDDAMLCTKICPQWPRGWARLGAAQLCLGHYRAALSAYRKGIELQGGPGSREMQLGLQLAAEALAGQGDRRDAAHE